MRRQLVDMEPITIRVYNATFPPSPHYTSRLAALRCVALRCVALRCVALSRFYINCKLIAKLALNRYLWAIKEFSICENKGIEREVFKGPKILPSQQLGAAVAPWPGATGLIASVTADDMAHKGQDKKMSLSPKLHVSKVAIRRLRRVKPHRDLRKYITYYMCDYESLKIGSPYPVRVMIRRFGFPLHEKFREGSRCELNTAVAESTSEEAIGETAECSKIHELSDRVRLSGVCSVKLALAHRIASDRATAAAATVPRDEVLLMGSTISIKSNGFCRKIHSAIFRAAGGVASSEEIRKFGKSFGFRFTAWIRLSARHFSNDESTTLVQELLLRIRDDTTKPKDGSTRGGDGTAK
ncbi:hypothetical protein G5I_01112 [Acromyrmex echinatior]|uniref:Uncharacterized protein n=1 Tax=Acromyrmex echinatior TaxID=103372 RepID=F4W6L7_ACREC|nr:hypothetical protein G5I_01112 [Acromyrmex echinatior]